MNFLFKAAAALTMLALPHVAIAQDYPSRPISLIIGSSAGGTSDTFARFVAEGLSKELGQPVVVENRPNPVADGEMIRSAADGYTLAFSAVQNIMNSVVIEGYEHDMRTDITPIGAAVESPIMLVAGAKTGFTTLDDVIAASKERTLLLGTGGPRSSPAFFARLFSEVTGVELRHVNYSGGAEVMVDMIAGRLDVYVGTYTTVLPYLQDGSLVPIAMLGNERLAALPDVPSIAELGHSDAAVRYWYGLMGPADLPQDIVDKLETALAKVLAEPASTEFFERIGGQIFSLPADEFTAFIDEELTKWKAIGESYAVSAN